MRAKLPNGDGLVTRDGVKLAYEIYGDAPDTMLFIPPWSIVHSRIYKAQLPYFSERFRCITYDGRGNGNSDRPEDIAAYTLDNYLADALAVMDALDVGQAILVGLSFGGLLASVLAAYHPERVRAAILAGIGAKIWPSVDAACDSIVRVVDRIRPNPANAEVMQRNYAAYRRIYPATKSIFRS